MTETLRTGQAIQTLSESSTVRLSLAVLMLGGVVWLVSSVNSVGSKADAALLKIDNLEKLVTMRIDGVEVSSDRRITALELRMTALEAAARADGK